MRSICPSASTKVALVPGKERVWLWCFTKITIILISTNLPDLTSCWHMPSTLPEASTRWMFPVKREVIALVSQWYMMKIIYCMANCYQHMNSHLYFADHACPSVNQVDKFPVMKVKFVTFPWYNCNWGKSMPKNNCNFHFYQPFLTCMPEHHPGGHLLRKWFQTSRYQKGFLQSPNQCFKTCFNKSYSLSRWIRRVGNFFFQCVWMFPTSDLIRGKKHCHESWFHLSDVVKYN